MKALSYARRRVNFMPEDLRPASPGHRLLVGAVLLAVIGLPLAAGGARGARWWAERRLQEAASRQAQVASELSARIQARDASAEQLAAGAVRKALSEKLYWADVFKELSNVAPKSGWLTMFETTATGNDGKRVVIAGMSASQTDVAEFFARLERSYFFRFVEMKFTELSEINGSAQYRFQFEGRVFDDGKGGRDGAG